MISASESDRLLNLHADFESASERLTKTRDADKRRSLLREIREILSKLDAATQEPKAAK